MVYKQFELSKEFITELKLAIDAYQESWIRKELSPLHPADIAEALENITSSEASFVYHLLDEELQSDVIVELDDDARERILQSLTSKEIAENVDLMDADDATDVIEDLPEEQREEVIQLLEDEEQKEEIRSLLVYDEDTAGGLMDKDFISANSNWTVDYCFSEMRKQAEEVDNVYTIYVVNNDNKLLGTLSLKKFLFTDTKTKIKELYNQTVNFVKADVPAEEVAYLMDKYDMVVMPVVDKDLRLIGRITIDDVVDVIKEEAEKDYQLASGISEKVESGSNVWKLSRARIPWLVIGLFGGIMGAQLIGNYEGQLLINPALAFFMPMIAAMGGNAGVQSSAIVVQGLANNSMKFDSIFKSLSKEFTVALINGIICSSIIFSVNILMGHNINLAITVATALMTVIIVATIFGTFIPIALNKYNIDPALATGPFITTINDVLGLFIYFTLASLLF